MCLGHGRLLKDSDGADGSGTKHLSVLTDKAIWWASMLRQGHPSKAPK